MVNTVYSTKSRNQDNWFGRLPDCQQTSNASLWHYWLPLSRGLVRYLCAVTLKAFNDHYRFALVFSCGRLFRWLYIIWVVDVDGHSSHHDVIAQYFGIHGKGYRSFSRKICLINAGGLQISVLFWLTSSCQAFPWHGRQSILYFVYWQGETGCSECSFIF